MKITRLIVLLACSVAFCSSSWAQSGPSSTLESQREAMRQVAFLVGEWEGDGWMDMGDHRATFHSKESVEARIDSLALIVEGLHRSDVPGRAEPMVIHHALAMLTYDPGAEIYRFNTQVHRGGTGRYEGYVEGDAFIWRMSMRGTQIRYTIRIDEDGRWHEVGERSADGDSWTQFFEMTLERVVL